jgi:hypothetical protein
MTHGTHFDLQLIPPSKGVLEYQIELVVGARQFGEATYALKRITLFMRDFRNVLIDWENKTHHSAGISEGS